MKRVVTLTLALGVIVVPVDAGVVADVRNVVVRQRCVIALQVSCALNDSNERTKKKNKQTIIEDRRGE